MDTTRWHFYPSSMSRLAAGLWILGLVACVANNTGCTADSDPGDTGFIASDAGDAGADDASPSDAGFDGGPFDTADTGPEPDAGPPPPPVPARIFFVGNSFTLYGPVPRLVDQLAQAAGFPDPEVDYRAVGGQTLQWHRADTAAEAAPGRVDEGWDVVVLQEYSTRPTEIGDPLQFKEDATWFHDRAREANPECRVILYETWARHPDHALYPGSFRDPMDMQAQLRTHYFDAAEAYIPANAMTSVDVAVAPVGDAWEWQLMSADPIRLHAGDDYHPNAAGEYLNALVIYSTIYGRRAAGQVALGVSPEDAAALQRAADAITGETRLPPSAVPIPLAVGDSVRLDVGPREVEGWPAIRATGNTTGAVMSLAGAATSIAFSAAAFDGVQEGGRGDNGLGWPADVSRDSLWVGSFDGHEAALARRGTLAIRGLAEGHYEVEVFASRTGTDGAAGRLTRYRIGDQAGDLDVSDNAATTVRFDVAPLDGQITLEVSVSPEGGARFGYLGAVVVTRVD